MSKNKSKTTWPPSRFSSAVGFLAILAVVLSDQYPADLYAELTDLHKPIPVMT